MLGALLKHKEIKIFAKKDTRRRPNPFIVYAKSTPLPFLEIKKKINREYVYSAVVYKKYLTRLRELIIFEPWRENYHFSQTS